MIEVSKTDFNSIINLLDILSKKKGQNIKENETSRKAGLLCKKLRKKLA